MNKKIENNCIAKAGNIADMKNGWIIGNFVPTLFKTNDFEIAIKEYKIGDYEQKHFHQIAEEFTVIIQGEVQMNNVKFVSGDIIHVPKNCSTDFKAISDVQTVVIKIPSVKNDKFIVNND